MTASKPRRAAVVGTGTMGPGLGAVLARAGLDVVLYDTDPQALERARSGSSLPRASSSVCRVRACRVAWCATRPTWPLPWRGRTSCSRLCPSGWTSSAGCSPRASGWCAPTRSWPPTPRACCLDLVDRGVIDAAGLDLCVRWGIGYKLAVVGPLELLDMAGLDIYASVGGYLNPDLSSASDVSPTIKRLTAEGRLGLKTGQGIFDYTPDEIEAQRAQRAARLIAVRQALSDTESHGM